jgi:3-methyl-2-oxobutanoate hydroxymethyltransferase
MRKVTTTALSAMKDRGERIAMVTAYDFTFSQLLDRAGVDVLLVGDSLGMVIQGEETTLGVTLDQMIYHCQAVARGAERALVVGDMPFGSFQITPDDAIRNASRLLGEGRAHAVKIEGGQTIAPTARRLVEAGIPVMGHIGLTPQSVHQLGGFKAQGRDSEAARAILEDARALEESGCFSLVLECVPGSLAEHITAELSIPTIGIGAGARCDGQVLVCYDMLGMNDGFKPRFLKTYASLGEQIESAASEYISEVREGRFPAEEHTIGGALDLGDEPPSDLPIALYGRSR